MSCCRELGVCALFAFVELKIMLTKNNHPRKISRLSPSYKSDTLLYTNPQNEISKSERAVPPGTAVEELFP